MNQTPMTLAELGSRIIQVLVLTVVLKLIAVELVFISQRLLEHLEPVMHFGFPGSERLMTD